MTTYAYTKAAKRRARKRIELPGLAAVPRKDQARAANGTFASREEDPAIVALSTRCRLAGWKDTKDNRNEARAQSMEGQAGLAITLGSRNATERTRLWTVYAALDAVEEAYARHILGQRRHPNVSKMELLPEPLEADPSMRVDLRSPEEKQRDATNAWMRWRGYLGHLSAHERTVIHDALLHRIDLVRDARLAANGVAFVAALRVFADVVDRR